MGRLRNGGRTRTCGLRSTLVGSPASGAAPAKLRGGCSNPVVTVIQAYGTLGS